MRIETVEYKIYRFGELSPEAKEKANEERLINEYRNPWADEHQDSLKEFAKVFPVIIGNWQYDAHTGWINISLDEDRLQEGVSDLKGLRLRTWLLNNFGEYLYKKRTKYYTKNAKGERLMNSVGQTTFKHTSKIFEERASCPLTGYCGDESLMDPIHAFIEKPVAHMDLMDLMRNCADSWIEEGVQDNEYFESLDWFAQHAEENGLEFTEDGKQYN